MGDELANLLKIFKRVEKDGRQATLSVSTNAGKTTVKLELTSSLSKPAPSLPSVWRSAPSSSRPSKEGENQS